MVCGNANKSLKLNESESTKDRYILEGLFAGPFGVENRNKRIYKADEYLKHLLSIVVEHIYDTDPAYLEDLMPWSENLPDICRKDS